MKKKIAIIGVGGRTGTMLASELGKNNHVLGVSRERTVSFLRNNDFYINKGDEKVPFQGRVIKDSEFNKEINPDIVFLTNKNPVGRVLKYYFERSGPRKPVFVLSQNGIDAINSAQKTLSDFKDVKIVRMILFNTVDLQDNVLKYRLPVRASIAQALGEEGVEEVYQLLKGSGFIIKKLSKKNSRNLEFSKLFLNLIGMASASRGLSIKEGFKDKETFKEEIRSLKEYIEIVRLAGGKFLNFKKYPIKVFVFLISLPIFMLLPFRNRIAEKIIKVRGNKTKDLDEIEYYNGGVVKLARQLEKKKKEKIDKLEFRQETDVTKDLVPKAYTNQKIYWRAQKRLHGTK